MKVHSIKALEGGLRMLVLTAPGYTPDDDFEIDDQGLPPTSPVGPTIALLIGTHRRGSISAKIARMIARIYRDQGVTVDLIDPADLPLTLFAPEAYDHRYETDSPLAQRFINADGLHVVVPEYNGSYAGVLKHILDIQPYKQCFDRKPVCLTGIAAGEWGGLRAVEQIQQVFAYRNAHIHPERVFLKEVEDVSPILGPELIDRLKRQATGFSRFVRCIKPLVKTA
jgi:NAD(P)H-dependent FMN reductase